MVEFLIDRALDALLVDLMVDVEPEALVRSFQLLAAKHPHEIYEFMVEILRSGDAQANPEVLRRQLGFAPPRG
jgi:hypothetical protein